MQSQSHRLLSPVRKSLLCIALLVAAFVASAQQRTASTMAFTLSMPAPSNQLYHVVFRCDGLKGETQDFKMPVWTTGYYVVQHFAQNVQNFRAEDGAGKSLTWEKTTTNAWRVKTGNAPTIVVSYDVKATRSFVGSCFLDENRGYITPAGMFLHVGGQIQHPSTVTIEKNPNWSTIATGLDPVSPDKPHTYAAPDFDILYDSPILMGNLEVMPSFEIQGIRHNFVGYNPAIANPEEFMNDLKAVIEAGIAIIGDIPYKHYTFLAIGPGGGGIEHLNSTSVGFSGARLGTRSNKLSQFGFLSHEYFHHYNVKRIRPVELGPFDYDRENRTKMLWVSEGFTSYYQQIMLRRAGIMTDEELLDAYRRNIVAYENSPGHLFQSATESSYNTWAQGSGAGGRRGGAGGIRKTISYYDKGPVLGLLLDFKIRHETKNAKSLDTVMRTLYREYYQDKKRGWTEREFRAVCERIAGTRLTENFDYAYTTREIDYSKYLGYAGLEIEPPKALTNANFGAIVEDREGMLVVSALEEVSPARQAKLAVDDRIMALDGVSVNAQAFNDAVAAKKPGDAVSITDSRGRERKVVLGNKMERTFRMKPMANPNPLQAAIFKDWTRIDRGVPLRTNQ